MLKNILDGYSEKLLAASLNEQTEDINQIFKEFRSEFGKKPPNDKEVLFLLENIFDYDAFSDLILMSAWYNLSKSYCPALITIVDSESQKHLHDQAVDLLIEVGDESAIEILKKAISYQWDDDEWFDVPRKAMQALANIGTEECTQVFRDLMNNINAVTVHRLALSA